VTLALAGCSAGAALPEGATRDANDVPPLGSITMLFAGDVMLGRGVSPVVASDPWSVFGDLNAKTDAADLSVANLESALTLMPHTSSNPNALEADPSVADILAAAGFDAVSVANNHAGDAGAASITDTLDALRGAGVSPVGGGRTAAEAYAPVIIRTGGFAVALLAFDATGGGLRASQIGAGVAAWDSELAGAAVARARTLADIVAVSVHGGAEYQFGADPYLSGIGRELASWGVDVVWCHGPHVVQPTKVVDPDGDGRPTVAVTSLGNLLFDQSIPGTTRGAVLEVEANASGVFAYRVGVTDTTERRVSFVRWRPPQGDAVVLDSEWYSPTREIKAWSVPPEPTKLPALPRERRVDASVVGDANGDGRDEVVVSYRSPFRETPENSVLPPRNWTDSLGLASHLGVYESGTLRPLWVAGTVVHPVSALAPCGSGMAVAYSTLDSPATVATELWRWQGFGFVTAGELPGPGTPVCTDIDADGNKEPAIVERGSQ